MVQLIVKAQNMANLKKRLKAVKKMEKYISIIENDIGMDEINFMTMQLLHMIHAWTLLYSSITDAIEGKETPPRGVKRLNEMTLIERVGTHLWFIKEDMKYRFKCLLGRGIVK